MFIDSLCLISSRNGENREDGSFDHTAVIFRHPMFQTHFLGTLLALVGIQLGQLGPALQPIARDDSWHILYEILLAIHSLMDVEVLLDSEVLIDIDGLVAQRTHIDLLVLFLVLCTLMGIDARVIGTVYF